MFQTEVRIEGFPAGTGTGYSKKESQQNAAQMAIKKVKDPEFIATVNESKTPQQPVTAIAEEQEFEAESDTDPAQAEPTQSKSPCDVPEPQDRDLQ